MCERFLLEIALSPPFVALASMSIHNFRRHGLFYRKNQKHIVLGGTPKMGPCLFLMFIYIVLLFGGLFLSIYVLVALDPLSPWIEYLGFSLFDILSLVDKFEFW